MFLFLIAEKKKCLRCDASHNERMLGDCTEGNSRHATANRPNSIPTLDKKGRT
jgi:hypothetical protein